MAERRFPRWLAIPGVVIILIVLLIIFWRWDWFIPIVESRASAALGRPVTIAHLHVQLGRVTHVVADDVEVANPKSFPEDSRFAKIDHLGIAVDIMAYISDRVLRIPSIDIDHPVVEVATSPSGEENWKLSTGSSSDNGGGSSSPQIGDLRIQDGHATVEDPEAEGRFRDGHRDQGGRGGKGVATAGECKRHLCRPADHRSLRRRRDPLPARRPAPLPHRPPGR